MEEQKREEQKNEQKKEEKIIPVEIRYTEVQKLAANKYIVEKKEKTNVTLVKCPLCDFMTDDYPTFFGHFYSLHVDKENSKIVAQTHEATIYNCDICGKSFYNYHEIFSHILLVHPDAFLLALDETHKEVLMKYKDEIKNAMKNGWFYCPIDTYRTRSANDFIVHIQFTHSSIKDDYMKIMDEVEKELTEELTKETGIKHEILEEKKDEEKPTSKKKRAKVVKTDEIG